MVSSRLSLCTRTPVGSTPRIATSAMAMTPRLIATSTMVKAATAFFSTILIQDSPELQPGRLIHAGPAGQPVDADEMVRVIVRRLYRHVRGCEVTARAREKDASFRQGYQLVSSAEQLPLRIETDIRQRPHRTSAGRERKCICIEIAPVVVWIRDQRRYGNQLRRIHEIEFVGRDQDALGQSLPFGNVAWIFLAGLVAHRPFGQQRVGGVLPVDEVGQLPGPTVSVRLREPRVIKVGQMRQYSRRDKHHVNRGASADGPQ